MKQHEICVLCGKVTKEDVDTKVSKRKHYIAGSGQLCEKCYQEIYQKNPKK